MKRISLVPKEDFREQHAPYMGGAKGKLVDIEKG